MKKKSKIVLFTVVPILIIAIVAILLVALLPTKTAVFCEAEGTEVKVLFTHDIHDHYEAHSVIGTEEYLGGLGRLSTAITANRTDATVVLDAGDYSMGSIMQTAFSSDGAELRLLGALGYDATTFGNHEFDYGPIALANSLDAARASGEALPSVLSANLACVTEDTGSELSAALKNYGAKQYTVIERGGVKIGIFGLTPTSAMSSAYRADTDFEDEIKSAKKAVKALKVGGAEIIVCISHGGTSSIKIASADEKIARQVDGIDVIVSGHSHTVIQTPLYVNGTYIVSCGQYAERLGAITLVKDGDSWGLKAYELIEIDSDFAVDESIENKIDYFLGVTDTVYMEKFGYDGDEVIAYSDFSFNTGLPYGNNHYNEPLGQLIGDAEKYAVKLVEGDDYVPIDVAIVFDAAIRGTIEQGKITAADAFNTRSLGLGEDNLAGDPVVTFYLYGKEIRHLCEVDASLTDFSAATQIYMSGVSYTYNPSSLFLARVENVYTVADGQKTAIESDKLYRVSTCYYNVNTFAYMTSASCGILSVKPKDADGKVIENFSDTIVYTEADGNAVELKDWLSVAQYLESFEEKDGLPAVDAYYDNLFSQRILQPSADWVGYTVLVICIIAVSAAVAVPIVVVKRVNKNKRKRSA